MKANLLLLLCMSLALITPVQAIDYVARWSGVDGTVYLKEKGTLVTSWGDIYFPLKKRNKNQPAWAESGWHGQLGYIYLDSRSGDLEVWARGIRFKRQ